MAAVQSEVAMMWQLKHQQGGTIMVFSDLKLVRLAKPIKFAIPLKD
jgi:hypothetical protein